LARRFPKLETKKAGAWGSFPCARGCEPAQL
jgi:hypothetical protein